MAGTAPNDAVFRIQGREVRLPAVVREASSMAATYLVDARAARQLLPGPELVPAELLPNRALLSIACIDYRDNDLGDYDEVSIALFVRERSAPAGLPFLGTLVDLVRNRLGTYIAWLPVNQDFTREAGCTIWGFPKTLEEIDFEERNGRRACSLRSGGRHVLTLSVARGGTRTLPEAAMTTYTWIAGSPHRTPFVSGAEGVGFALGGAELELGDHAMAGTLRELGLPRRALISMWMERMHGRFEAPSKL